MTKKYLASLPLVLLNSFIISMALSLFIMPIIDCYLSQNSYAFLADFLWVFVFIILAILFFRFTINQIKLLIDTILSSLMTWLVLYFSNKDDILSIIQSLWTTCQVFYPANENARLTLFVISAVFLVVLFLQILASFVFNLMNKNKNL